MFRPDSTIYRGKRKTIVRDGSTETQAIVTFIALPSSGSIEDSEKRDADYVELKPDASLKLRNHSPTGFEWGFLGSGPSQLALAILLDFTGRAEWALKHYGAFKEEHVSRWGPAWSIDGKTIHEWLRARAHEMSPAGRREIELEGKGVKP